MTFAGRSALVIGAGIGGIATAARLAKAGYSVKVLEKNEIPGGRCGTLEIEGHRFDTGPTLYLMPELYRQAFADLGEQIEDHLDLQRVDPTYQIHFDDGLNLTLSSNLEFMKTQLEAIEPGSFSGMLRYLAEGDKHYRISVPNVVNRDFRTPQSFFTLKNIILFLRIKALKNHFANLGQYFQDDRLKFGFLFQNLYMGLNPYKSPAMYSLMPYTELADGVWFPKGGLYQVITALVKIAEKLGVAFEYNAPVTQIRTSGGQITGVELADGRQLTADIIVANADLSYVCQQLLPNDEINARRSARLQRKKYGCSALVFFWGLNRIYPQLSPHNLFMAPDIEHGFDVMFDDLSLTADPSFYVHAPTRIDSSLAPEGQDTLVVAVPVPHINEENPQNWPELTQQARKYILARLTRLGLDNLESHIKFEISFSPEDWKKRYNLAKGSAHGLGHELLQMGYMRPAHRHARYRNLYFVGASTHPGTGLPSVLTSAKFAANRILEELPV
jgi:phytoene desaturase